MSDSLLASGAGGGFFARLRRRNPSSRAVPPQPHPPAAERSAGDSVSVITSQRIPTIRAHLERILASPEFSSAPRQQAFLRFVVEEWLAGRTAEIKETTVATHVFGKPASYDPRIDSTVRVEASKLRQRLAHFYEGTGAAELVHIAIPKGAYHPLLQNPDLPPSVPPRPSLTRHYSIAASFVLLVLSAYWLLSRQPDSPFDPSGYRLTLLSRPGSYAESPAISADAKFVIYAADRDSEGFLNLWRHPLDGAHPTRLTSSPIHHDMPVLTPNGSSVVFRAGGLSGALFQVPSAGGAPSLLVDTDGARDPRISPDGKLVAFWIPSEPQTFDYGRVYIRPLQVSPAHRGIIRSFGDFAHAARPIWAGSNRHLLVLGTWVSQVPEKEFDAWLLPMDGAHPSGPLRKTGLIPFLRQSGYFSTIVERSLIELEDFRHGWLYMTLPLENSSDLYRIRLDPDSGSISGKPQRMTFGSGYLRSARAAGAENFVFTRDSVSYGLYSLHVPASGRPATDLLRHSAESGVSRRPAVDPAGRFAVWESLGESSIPRLVFFDLSTRLPRQFDPVGETENTHAILSPDARSAAFRPNLPGFQPIYLRTLSGGPPREICDNCGTPADWTAGGSHILYITGGRRARIGLLEVATGKWRDWIQHPSYSLYGARARLDPSGNGLVVFYADNGPRTRQIFLAPVSAFQPAPPQQWIPLSDGAHWEQSPAFSPSGDRVYFVKRDDGFSCIMARNLHPGTGQPAGPPWAVQHFHTPSQSLSRSLPQRGVDALWAAGDRLYFNLDQRRSEVWYFHRSHR